MERSLAKSVLNENIKRISCCFKMIIIFQVLFFIFSSQLFASLSDAKEELSDLKIKVLSGTGDLSSAKEMAKELEESGYKIKAVDFAPRSNFINNTIYFAEEYKRQAENLASSLGDENAAIKPLTWPSKFDLIVVAGRASTKEATKVHHVEQKQKEPEETLKKEEIEEIKAEEEILPEQIAPVLPTPVKREQKRHVKSKPEILTLDEAIRIAVSNNAFIKEASEKVKSSIEEKKSARADFLPKASAEYSYTHLNEAPSVSFSNPFVPGTSLNFTVGNQDTYKWNVTLAQPLFTGFALLSQYNMKELGIKQSQTQKDMAVLNLVRDVKKAYFGLLLAKKVLKVTEDAVENLQSHARDAEQYYQQGMIPYNDLLKSKVALANVIQEREKARANVNLAGSALNMHLNYDINTPLEVEDILSTPEKAYDLEEAMHEAMEKRPELKLLHLGAKTLDEGIRAVNSAYYPKIAMVGVYEQTGDNLAANENDYGAIYNTAMVLQAKWDLFEGGKTRSEAAKYKYEKKALVKKLEGVENGIKLEVKNAFSNLQVSDKNIKTAQESLAQARENWRITNLQYKEQIATSTDVLDARTYLSQAETNYYGALYGYMIALSDLERASGKGDVKTAVK